MEIILFESIGEFGRIGNAMFQYAALKALTLYTNSIGLLPPDLDSKVWHGQKCLLNSFNLSLQKAPFDVWYQINRKLPIYTHGPDHVMKVYPEFYTWEPPLSLFGHFESEFYFKDYEEEIRKDFTFNTDILLTVKKYLTSIKLKYGDKPIIGIHYRRGDLESGHSAYDWYLKFIHYNIENNFNYKDFIFLVFSGGSRNEGNSTEEDINWCRNNIKINESTEFCNLNSTIHEMCALSLCDHLILSAKSTFAWWGGYLGNKKRTVIVPKQVPKDKFNPNIYWSKYFKVIDYACE